MRRWRWVVWPLLPLWLFCTMDWSLSSSGGDDGGTTEIPNAVLHGRLYEVVADCADTTVVPCDSALVRLFPHDYDPVVHRLGIGGDTVHIDTGYTDARGDFAIAATRTKRYNLVSRSKRWAVGILPGISLTDTDSVHVTDTLVSLGGLRGRVTADSSLGGGTAVVYVPGTPFITTADDTGAFVLSELPSDTLEIHFAYAPADTDTVTRIDTVIRVQPPSDDTADIGEVGLDSGTVRGAGSWKSDSIAVRTILDANGLNSVAVGDVSTPSSDGRIGALDLEGLGLDTLPSVVGGLDSLHTLLVKDNRLKGLPSETAHLSKLVTLDAEANSLLELPAGVGELPLLRMLNLRSNDLRSLPGTVVQLERPLFSHLYLEGNFLCALPDSIRAWADGQQPGWHVSQRCDTYTGDSLVVRAILDANRLDTVPVEQVAATSGGPRIAILVLDRAAIPVTVLPEVVGELDSLHELVATDAQLGEIPASIGRLVALEYLSLSRNRLVQLPDRVGDLQNLVGLHLTANLLTSLPASIVNLTGLSDLDLDSNRLCALPSDIATWANAFDPDWRNTQSCVPSEGMVEIPAGYFISDGGDTVSIGTAFFMDTVEVTEAMMCAVLPDWPDAPGTPSSVLPATNVSWYAAVRYCNALSRLMGQDTAYSYESIGWDTAAGLVCHRDRAGFRLPTADEWELAARGGRGLEYATDDGTLDCGKASYDGCGNAGPSPVASYPANPFGLHDLSGNVWEWCTDHWDSRYPKPANSRTDYVTELGPDRVVRGGAWDTPDSSAPSMLSCGEFDWKAPSYRAAHLGMRTVLRAE